MNNNKQVIQIVEKFPTILYEMKFMLSDRNEAGYILDASNYAQADSMITIAEPEMLLLDINLPGKTGIEIVGTAMGENLDIQVGMITTNAGTYYKNLCQTICDASLFDHKIDLQSAPEVLAQLQLN